MSRIYEVLETCLQELEKGENPELTLERYPDLAVRIRPILDDFVQMRNQYVPDPSPDAFLRGRSKLLELARKKRIERSFALREKRRITYLIWHTDSDQPHK